MIEELADLDNFAKLTKLKYLSLMRNPVTTKPKYRLYVIHTLPSVRVLDYRKVTDCFLNLVLIFLLL